MHLVEGLKTLLILVSCIVSLLFDLSFLAFYSGLIFTHSILQMDFKYLMQKRLKHVSLLHDLAQNLSQATL